jgi:polysaccharide biosynthesis/export protein
MRASIRIVTLYKCFFILALVCLSSSYVISQAPPEDRKDPGEEHTQVTPKVLAEGTKPSRDPKLRIGSGDVLDVKVYSNYGAPDISQKARVSNTGEISLAMVGNVPVAGLTAEEAEARIERNFQEQQFLKRPHVSVFVDQYGSEEVSVLGEVLKPGMYPLVSARTLLDMIAVAGGVTPTAGNVATITHKPSPQQPTTVPLSGEGTQRQNPLILAGDTIYVEKAGIVYVVGEVGRPGGFPINSNTGITVLQAIALAEGTKPGASLNKSKLIRKTQGTLSETQIPLKKILASKSSDLPLRPGDIVFVPSSAAKGAARRGLEAIVQTATGVAIYRPR